MTGINNSHFRFSYNLSKGSIQQREKLAEKFNEQAFEKVSKLFKDVSEVPIRELERTYRQSIPEHKPIVVKKTDKSADDCEGFFSFRRKYEHNCIYPSRCVIEIQSEKNKINQNLLPSFMHESIHFFDILLQPRQQLRYLDLDAYELGDIAENIYYKHFYIEEENCENLLLRKMKLKYLKHITNKNLKGLSSVEKLCILKFMKTDLECEKHAYNESLKYTKKLKGQIKESYNKDFVDSFYFDDKIQVLKKMIYKIIANERAKNALIIAKSPKDKLIAYKDLIFSKLL